MYIPNDAQKNGINSRTFLGDSLKISCVQRIVIGPFWRTGVFRKHAINVYSMFILKNMIRIQYKNHLNVLAINFRSKNQVLFHSQH